MQGDVYYLRSQLTAHYTVALVKHARMVSGAHARQ